MPPTISVWHYMCSYACACKITPLKASYILVHVWHRLTSHVRRGLGSICEYQHLTLGRVASVGSLDMIGPQRPGLSAAEGDAVFTLFGRLLHTMRNNDYMTRLTATPKNSQDVMLFHRSIANRALNLALHKTIDQSLKDDLLVGPGGRRVTENGKQALADMLAQCLDIVDQEYQTLRSDMRQCQC